MSLATIKAYDNAVYAFDKLGCINIFNYYVYI